MRFWKITICIGLLAMTVLPGTAANAQTPTQCDELTGYSEAVLTAINDEGSLDELSTSLDAIPPPSLASDWRQALIDRIDLQLQFQGAAPVSTEEGDSSPPEQIAKSNSALHSAGEAVTANCAEFGEFASEVDEALSGILLLADTPMPLGIIVPVSGRTVGLSSAPVTVVEWGDYT